MAEPIGVDWGAGFFVLFVLFISGGLFLWFLDRLENENRKAKKDEKVRDKNRNEGKA